MEDWPRELFLGKAELYQLQLEERLERAEEEADRLVKLFEVYGVPQGARILDLCCGIGRHAVALAKRGFFVVGVDFSAKFLARAEELAKNAGVQGKTEFVREDIRRLGNFPKQHFQAALSLYTSFGYYGEEDDKNLLLALRRLVDPGGIFVLDMFSRDSLIRHFVPTHVIRTKSHMVIEEMTFDFERARFNSRWFFFLPEGEGWRYAGEAQVSVRAYALHEIVRMLAEAGWQYCAAHGGLDMSPYGLEARRLVVVARNPG
ncbi:MAG: class I SAM-dependent methyltransferase [Candidatus Bipolaricaulaceae bacterium]